MFPEDPIHAAGRLATNWERLDATIEEAVLELAGCPDYRGRAVTTYLASIQRWKAFEVLLLDRFGDDVLKTSAFKSLKDAVSSVRSQRNAIIHADWRAVSTESDAVVEGVDLNARKALVATELRYTAGQIGQIADLATTVHLQLLNYLAIECGIVLLERKFDLPVARS